MRLVRLVRLEIGINVERVVDIAIVVMVKVVVRSVLRLSKKEFIFTIISEVRQLFFLFTNDTLPKLKIAKGERGVDTGWRHRIFAPYANIT